MARFINVELNSDSDSEAQSMENLKSDSNSE